MGEGSQNMIQNWYDHTSIEQTTMAQVYNCLNANAFNQKIG